MEQVEKWLALAEEVIQKGPYKDDWASLGNYPVPAWYRDGKFGIFIHWGPYCVPAFSNEWYPREMYQKDSPVFRHHESAWGPHRKFGYKDFIPLFKGERFDASAWAELFKASGARFVMPVAEHHDGFQMYDSELSAWCATKMGPKRDILGELSREFGKRDLVFATSSHRVEHYWFLSGGRDFDSDIVGEIPRDHLYWPSLPLPGKEFHDTFVPDLDVEFLEDWLARCCEIVDKYRPKLVFFDWWIQVEAMKPYLRKFAAFYYNRAAEWGEEVAINYKYDAFMYRSAVRDIERGQLSSVSPDFWQNDTSVAKNSWGYTVGNEYKKAPEIIADLIDVVSKNGALLLNVGPKADGTIPDEDQAILRAVGKWLSVNGEGIYGTTYWKRYGEGPTLVEEGYFTDTKRPSFTTEDFRFTFKDGRLYVFALKWPEDGIARIKTLGRKSKHFNARILGVEALAAPGKARWQLCDDWLTVRVAGLATDEPVCLRLDLD